MKIKKYAEISQHRVELDEILSKPPNVFLSIGNTLIICSMMILSAFSWFLKYPDVVEAPAVIITEKPSLKIYARNRAPFDTILISNGWDITKGEVLAILENDARSKDMLKLMSIMDTLTLKRAKRIPNLELPNLYIGGLHTHYFNFRESLRKYYSKNALNPVLNEEYENEVNYEEKSKKLSSLLKEYSFLLSEIKLAKNRITRFRTLHGKGVLSNQEIEDKEIEFIQLKKNLTRLNASILEVKKSLKINRNDSLKLRFNNNELVRAEVNSVFENYYILINEIKKWEYEYVLKSKIDGIAHFHDFWAKNKILETNDLVFTITPKGKNHFLAELQVPQKNYGKIKIGQKVLISIENYPESEFGQLAGYVKSHSSMPIEDTYSVYVKLPEKLESTYRKTLNLNVNMKARAEIITEDLRLLERLLFNFRTIPKSI